MSYIAIMIAFTMTMKASSEIQSPHLQSLHEFFGLVFYINNTSGFWGGGTCKITALPNRPEVELPEESLFNGVVWIGTFHPTFSGKGFNLRLGS